MVLREDLWKELLGLVESWMPPPGVELQGSAQEVFEEEEIDKIEDVAELRTWHVAQEHATVSPCQ